MLTSWVRTEPLRPEGQPQKPFLRNGFFPLSNALSSAFRPAGELLPRHLLSGLQTVVLLDHTGVHRARLSVRSAALSAGAAKMDNGQPVQSTAAGLRTVLNLLDQ